jgi:ABC-type branched-subunit amino acid transport system substrate-binding protein/LysM repeat protein
MNFGKSFAQVPLSTTLKVMNNKTYFVHQVAKQQTIYSICKTYQIEVNELIRGSEKTSLQDGETVLIPAKEQVLSKLFNDKTLNKEIIYLTENEDIANQNLPKSELKTEPKITADLEEPKVQGKEPIIKDSVVSPNEAKDAPVVNNTPKDVAKKDKAHQLFNRQFDTIFCENANTKSVNIALLLPLNLSELDLIDVNTNTPNTQKYFTYASFLEGAMLAVNEFKDKQEAQSLKVKVSVYDVGDEKSASKLILSNKLVVDGIDIIIGPVYYNAYHIMSKYAKEKKIQIFNPLSDKDAVIENNPYSFKIHTSKFEEVKRILEYIVKNQDVAQNLIVVYDSSYNSRALKNFVQKCVDSTKYFQNVSYLKIPSKIEKLNALLSPKNRNNIIYLAENEAFISEIITNTSKVAGEKCLFATKDFSIFAQTDSEYLLKMKVFYTKDFLKNSKNTEILNFERRYYEQFKELPDENALLSFDFTNCLIDNILKNCEQEGVYLGDTFYSGLVYRFHFVQYSNKSGYQNTETNLIEIDKSERVSTN